MVEGRQTESKVTPTIKKNYYIMKNKIQDLIIFFTNSRNLHLIRINNIIKVQTLIKNLL